MSLHRVTAGEKLWWAVAAVIPCLGTAAGGSADAHAWGPEERLTATAADSETGLNHTPLAIDAAGTLHLVWAEQDGVRGNYQIHTRRREAGLWQPAALVVPFRPEAAGSLLGAKFPSILCDGDDTLHLAWHDYRIAGINNAEIFYKSSHAGTAWDTSEAVEARLTTTSHPETNGDNGYVPTLAAEPGGDLHLVWYDYRYDGSAAEILYKSRQDDAWDLTPGDAADVNVSLTPGDSQFPAMAVDRWSRVHVAWHDDTSGNARILYSVRDPDTGAFAPPVELTSHALPAVTPALAVDAIGQLYLAWVDSRAGSRRIYARRREAFGAWSPERPASPPGWNADEPALAVDSWGRVHLAWHDTRVSALNREIWLQSIDAGAEWDSTGASDFRVSNGAGHSTRPSLLADGQGKLYVVWKDRRDGNHEIYFREATVSVPVGVSEAPPPGARLLVSPNPFTSGTRFTVQEGVLGTLVIRDVAGRLVRRWIVSGPVSLLWDGRDETGRSISPGVYFARVRNQPGTRLVKLR